MANGPNIFQMLLVIQSSPDGERELKEDGRVCRRTGRPLSFVTKSVVIIGATMAKSLSGPQ